MEDALAHSLTNLERDELAPVLILVLMEDALVRTPNCYKVLFSYVLILVLMEDALVLLNKCWCNILPRSLNPCFNGRCTRTIEARSSKYCKQVS